MKNGGYTGEMTKEQRLNVLNKLEGCNASDVLYKDFCPNSKDGHYWVDVTTIKDLKQVEICKNCNEVLMSEFRF